MNFNTCISICFCLLLPICTRAQELPDSLKFNDGPYIFYDDGKLISKSVINGVLETKHVSNKKFPMSFDIDKDEFTGINKLAVLSDIHGQYELCLELFKANGIIDNKNQWAFGDGHLVICGDIFDRGDKTTEVIWLIYNLEQQALKAGGKVHYLMGNHEYMALQGDFRYVHEDYLKVAELLGMSYDRLYADNTVLGRWLKTKSTVIKINDIIFLHGGISKAFQDNQIDLSQVNEHFRESMFMNKKDIRASSKYAKYYNSDGPIWYRGYFKGDLTKEDIDSLLTNLDANHIVVGHTSQKEIKKLYKGRIYAVDSSLKNGTYGEILIIEEGIFKRFTLEGRQEEFE